MAIDFNKRFEVTNEEKKKARQSIILLSVLAFIFLSVALVFIIIYPRKTKLKTTSDGELITEMLVSNDGDTYYSLSDKQICEYDTLTNKLIRTIDYRKDVESVLEGKDVELIPNSLDQFVTTFINGESGTYCIMRDNIGNLFKYIENEDGSLTITDDFLLAKEKTSYKATCYEGDDMYVVRLNASGLTELVKYDVKDISKGEVNSKYLWEISDETATTYKLQPYGANAQVWAFECIDSEIYIMSKNGIVKCSSDFNDYENISYYKEAEKYYRDYLVQGLKSADPAKLERYGLTEEKIDSLELSILEENYSKVLDKSTSKAKNESSAQFSETAEWCKEYNQLKGIMEVYKNSMDPTKYTVLYPGTVNIGGFVISKKTKMAYFASLLDTTIYSISIDDINGLKMREYFGPVSKPLDYINFKGRKFNTLRQSFSYNEFSNSMYVIFTGIDNVALINLDDGVATMENQFHCEYDIYSFTGDKNNDRIVYIYRGSKSTIKNEVTTFREIHSLSPRKAALENVFKTFIIISIIALVITLVMILLSYLVMTKKGFLFKLRVIKKDIKKHKAVYIALIPFVILLIMFCYYEAIGSIRLSFLNYTREKPSNAWNQFYNYIRIFNQDDFLLACFNTIFFLVFDLFFAIVPPLIFSFFLSLMTMKRYSKFIRTMMFIPSIIPGIASMLIWRTGIFGEFGVLNTIIHAFGGETVEFLSNGDISRWSLLLMGFPFVGGYLIFYGGLMNIPKDYYEAAELDGITIWKRFTKIDIPLIMPQIKYIFVTMFISSCQNYARTYMLKSSGTVTLAQKMYEAMISTGADYGLASAYATLLFIFLAAAIIVNFKQQRESAMGDNL